MDRRELVDRLFVKRLELVELSERLRGPLRSVHRLPDKILEDGLRELEHLVYRLGLHALLLAVRQLRRPRALVELAEQKLHAQIEIVLDAIDPVAGNGDLADVLRDSVDVQQLLGVRAVDVEMLQVPGIQHRVVRDLAARDVLEVDGQCAGRRRRGQPLVVMRVVQDPGHDLARRPAEGRLALRAEHLVAPADLVDGRRAVRARPGLPGDHGGALDVIRVARVIACMQVMHARVAPAARAATASSARVVFGRDVAATFVVRALEDVVFFHFILRRRRGLACPRVRHGLHLERALGGDERVKCRVLLFERGVPRVAGTLWEFALDLGVRGQRVDLPRDLLDLGDQRGLVLRVRDQRLLAVHDDRTDVREKRGPDPSAEHALHDELAFPRLATAHAARLPGIGREVSPDALVAGLEAAVGARDEAAIADVAAADVA